jgi:hypothetical protein
MEEDFSSRTMKSFAFGRDSSQIKDMSSLPKEMEDADQIPINDE